MLLPAINFAQTLFIYELTGISLFELEFKYRFRIYFNKKNKKNDNRARKTYPRKNIDIYYPR